MKTKVILSKSAALLVTCPFLAQGHLLRLRDRSTDSGHYRTITSTESMLVRWELRCIAIMTLISLIGIIRAIYKMRSYDRKRESVPRISDLVPASTIKENRINENLHEPSCDPIIRGPSAGMLKNGYKRASAAKKANRATIDRLVEGHLGSTLSLENNSNGWGQTAIGPHSRSS